MRGTLVRKLLRDVRLALSVIALLLAAFQCLWAKITQRITEEIIPGILKNMTKDEFFVFLKLLFKGPGKIVETVIGGETVNVNHALDVLSIGYVHPLTLTILCVWAVGRAAGSIAGEIDRGTMELLLAQPVARYRVVLAHLAVDLLTIPLLCLSLWAGNWLGVGLFGHIDFAAPPDTPQLQIDPRELAPALWNVAALLFALGGLTMWLSALGRFRGRVLGTAVLLTLVQFLVNVIGQMWDAVAPLRPFTVFYYYQAQQIILKHDPRWSVDVGHDWGLGQPLLVNVLAVLAAVGVTGYGLTLWTFCRRDLPAPL